MPETAKRTARVPILGEDGRISDDYIPAAIGEGVEAAEAAATRAETAATNAQGSATAAGQSATGAQGSASAASASATKAQQSATTAGEAVTQAQSAQKAAEAAKTGAESARDSAKTAASQAQQSATAAAESAANVVDKFIASAQATTLEPGSQATATVADQVLTIGVPKGEKGDKGDQGEKGDTGTGVPDGGTPGQLLSKTDSGTAWVDPPSGNVLKGTLGPAPLLSADDAYATKPRRLTVFGATRQNLWVNPSGTSGGVTVTSNDDGSMTLSGTSTSSINVQTGNVYVLKPSTQYTLSVDTALDVGVFKISERSSDGTELKQDAIVSGSKSFTFTTSDEIAYAIFMFYRGQSGDTFSGTYRVMLNEGSEPEPWCPPGLNSVDELSLMTAGKNLYKPFTSGKVTANDDGSMTVKASQETWANGALNHINLPAGTQVTLSSDNIYGPARGFGVYFYASDNSQTMVHLYNRLSQTIELSEDCVAYRCWFNGSTDSEVTSRVMMEIGSTATSFEPYQGSTTPIDLDGNTLCSLPDGTHDELTIDATGNVVLEKRVAVASAPTVAGSWTWDHSVERGIFSLPSAGPASQPDETSWMLCDKLPVRDGAPVGETSYAIVSNANACAKNPAITSTATAATVAGGAKYIYKLATPQTIPLPAVTLPTLPAPTVNVWADAEASEAGYAMDPDVELEYERDVTIAFNKLQAQISATTVREATNG